MDVRTLRSEGSNSEGNDSARNDRIPSDRSTTIGRIAPYLALSLFLLLPTLLTGNGPLSSNGTTSTTYAANRFPLTYQTDLGPLGTFSNQEATVIADFAFGEWTSVTSATVSFTSSGSLDRDVVSSTDPLISGGGQFSDGIFPVVYDNNGSITEDLIGTGASGSVYGFATSFSPDGLTYAEGQVVINGALTGRPNAATIYREVVTHEIGHMLGVDHSQVSLGRNYSLMYPTVLTDLNNVGFDPDDVAAISNLYPAAGFPATVGSISGRVLDIDGDPMSGVNILAVNAANGEVYSTVSDYLSGNDPRYRNNPPRTGAYRFDGLPAGNYYLRIEPIKANFTQGSSVASYDPPLNTEIYPEWYNGQDESGSMLVDNSNERTTVAVAAGGVTADIDIAVNSSESLTEATEYNGTVDQRIPLPFTLSNATLDQYAVQYSAPSGGAVTGVMINVGALSNLGGGGELVVRVHENVQGSIVGVPGPVRGTVRIPLAQLSADQENFVWLRGLGSAANFFTGDLFHVALEVVGGGDVQISFDNAQGTRNRTSYRVQGSNQWQNFPDGLTGAAGWNIDMTMIWSSVPAGATVPTIAVDPTSLAFGRVSVGEQARRSVTIRNRGTAPLQISQMSLTGAGRNDFALTGATAPLSVAPGANREIEIGFTPQSRSAVSANLVVTHNADGSPTSIALSGQGKEASIGQVADTFDLGTVVPNETATEEFIAFRNLGSDTMLVRGVEIVGPDAGVISAVGGSIPVRLAPTQPYTVRLRFRPTAEGTYNATVRIEHELESSPLDIPAKGISDDGQVGSVAGQIAVGGLRIAFDRVVPQPVDDAGRIELAVEGSGAAPVEILVVDLLGKVVRQSSATVVGVGSDRVVSIDLDREGLAAGVYAVVVRGEGGSVSGRVIVR